MAISDLVDQFVDLKRACGHKYAAQERWLRQFVEHCSRRGTESAEGALTIECVSDFLYTRGLRESTVRYQERALRDLADHATSLGMRVYTCPVGTCHRGGGRPPYIFSDDEIRRLFSAIDGQPIPYRSTRHAVDPVLFRLLYGTGLRVSEAVSLKVGDFDPEGGTLMVRDAKNGKDRVIPLTTRLAATLVEHVASMHPDHDPSHALFYADDPARHLSGKTVYDRFRRYLLLADIPHFDGGPRVHSFRHGFAVGCLRRWTELGEDLGVMLPYLRAYMGHAGPESTQYYLRLTADVYPEIVERMQLRFGYVIPRGADS